MSKLDLRTATRDELVAVVRGQAARIKELQHGGEAEELRQRLQSVQEQNALIREDMAQLRRDKVTDTEAVSQQLQTLGQKAVADEETIGALLQELDALRSATAPPSGPVAQGKVDALVSEVAVLRSTAQRLQRSLETAEAAHNAIAARAQEAEESWSAKLSAAEASVEPLRRELAAAAAEADELRASLFDSDRRVADSERRVALLASQLTRHECGADDTVWDPATVPQREADTRGRSQAWLSDTDSDAPPCALPPRRGVARRCSASDSSDSSSEYGGEYRDSFEDGPVPARPAVGSGLVAPPIVRLVRSTADVGIQVGAHCPGHDTRHTAALQAFLSVARLIPDGALYPVQRLRP